MVDDTLHNRIFDLSEFLKENMHLMTILSLLFFVFFSGFKTISDIEDGSSKELFVYLLVTTTILMPIILGLFIRNAQKKRNSEFILFDFKYFHLKIGDIPRIIIITPFAVIIFLLIIFLLNYTKSYSNLLIYQMILIIGYGLLYLDIFTFKISIFLFERGIKNLEISNVKKISEQYVSTIQSLRKSNFKLDGKSIDNLEKDIIIYLNNIQFIDSFQKTYQNSYNIHYDDKFMKKLSSDRDTANYLLILTVVTQFAFIIQKLNSSNNLEEKLQLLQIFNKNKQYLDNLGIEIKQHLPNDLAEKIIDFGTRFLDRLNVLNNELLFLNNP